MEPSNSIQEPSIESVLARSGVDFESNQHMETSFTTETVITEPRDLKDDADESDIEHASVLSE